MYNEIIIGAGPGGIFTAYERKQRDPSLKIAVFDEPEAGIDLWSFHRLADTFRDMHEKTGTTIVIISHQERILELADEIILMAGGRIERNIPKEEILKKGFVDDLCACRANCGIRGKDHVECAG